MGLAHYFVGIKLFYDQGGLIVTQRKFARDLLAEFDCLYFIPATFYLDPTLKLTSDSGSLMLDPLIHIWLVGKLNLLTNTRPNLSFVIQSLSQYMQLPYYRALPGFLPYSWYISAGSWSWIIDVSRSVISITFLLRFWVGQLFLFTKVCKWIS